MTATATPQVINDMCKRFDINKTNVIIKGFYRKNLNLHVTPCPASEKDQYLANLLANDPSQNTIVYVTQQKTAETVAQMLQLKNFQAVPYHAGMKNEERERIQNQFMNGETPIIVATIAFGMGIDKEDIRRIIHYNLPKSLENYSQEIGRAGRDGKTSHCEVLADKENISILENFIYGDTPEEQDITNVLEQIQKNEGNIWETKLYSLSRDTDIRFLPLKTLLVYLELHKIIKPKYTYFQNYTFRFHLKKDEILNRLNQFKKEISTFALSIFKHCITKKVWTTVNIDDVITDYQAPRARIIKALEFFDEQGWIELRSEQGIDVYEIITQDFDLNTESKKLYTLFKHKECNEINRIHTMVEFFEKDTCLNASLSKYFGEKGITNCGHCSICLTGGNKLPETGQKKPLDEFQFQAIRPEISNSLGNKQNATKITRFLCGIKTPLLIKLKAKALPQFGILESYPYKEVESWLTKNHSCKPA